MAYGTGGCVKKRTKKVNKGQTEKKAPGKNSIHHEDLALKTAAQYFGEELMPLLGIKGVAGYIAPTETVMLEARQMYQDFNYVLTDVAWIHLEFESDSLTTKDLRRFREYEAAVSRTFGVAVVTYVICSSQVKRLKSELTEGSNTYRVKVIRLKNRDADRVIEQLEEKQKRGKALDKSDLVPLLLKAGIDPTSIEYMDNTYVRTTADYCEYKNVPHYEDGIYVIVTVETYNEDELDMKMERLDELCTEAGAVEVLEADERIWKMRRNCQESVRLISLVSLTDDVVVPRDKVADAVKFVMKTGEKYPFTPLICAHVGDGNLHIVLCKCDLTDEEWENNVQAFHDEVYTYAYSIGGRLAGEHGIGAKKLAEMEKYTRPGELNLMRTIKKAMDPKSILNPGKIFNVD